MLVERRVVGEMAEIISTGDARYSLPHQRIRFFQTSPTYRSSDPSRLQRLPPSAHFNGQSQSLVTIDTRPILQTNPSHDQLTNPHSDQHTNPPSVETMIRLLALLLLLPLASSVIVTGVIETCPA